MTVETAFLTVDEALQMLPQSRWVDIAVGGSEDWERSTILRPIAMDMVRTATRLERAWPDAEANGYGLVMRHGDRYTLVRTKEVD